MQQLVVQVLLVGDGDLEDPQQAELQVVHIRQCLRDLAGRWQLGHFPAQLVQGLPMLAEDLPAV